MCSSRVTSSARWPFFTTCRGPPRSGRDRRPQSGSLAARTSATWSADIWGWKTIWRRWPRRDSGAALVSEEPPDAVLDLRVTRERRLPLLWAGGLQGGCQIPPVRARGVPGKRYALRIGGGGCGPLRGLQATTGTDPDGVSGGCACDERHSPKVTCGNASGHAEP